MRSDLLVQTPLMDMEKAPFAIGQRTLDSTSSYLDVVCHIKTDLNS